MDIKELICINSSRHPWETARLCALKNILRPHLFNGMKVLDVGCGDGFISRGLLSPLKEKELVAVDINLTDEGVQQLNELQDSAKYLNTLPENGSFDLLMVLDVIEHVECDQIFLAGLVDKYLSEGGKAIITVPAFQSLYSCHDTFLGHYRRYRLQELEAVSKACRLKIISSGYMFLSLFLPKLFIYKFLNAGTCSEGVGNWRRGKGVTTLIELVLKLDAYILISSSRLGIKIPGLTGWVLCEKRK